MPLVLMLQAVIFINKSDFSSDKISLGNNAPKQTTREMKITTLQQPAPRFNHRHVVRSDEPFWPTTKPTTLFYF